MNMTIQEEPATRGNIANIGRYPVYLRADRDLDTIKGQGSIMSLSLYHTIPGRYQLLNIQQNNIIILETHVYYT